MILSDRLQFIFDKLVPGQPVWDFCCDHGYLGARALADEHFPEVHFVDQVPHIIQRLKEGLSSHPGFSRAFFWESAGESLQTEIRGTVVIAGVGAFVMAKILRALIERNLLQAQTLILCPQRDEKKFFSGLTNYELRSEFQVLEKGRSRPVYIYRRT